MTSALILAAGFGTRLRPLTLERPKPVVPVGDRPLLAHVAAACRAAGIGTLVANAHHEHAKLSSIIEELKLDVRVVVEAEIRGTAGGVAGARAHFEPGAVLVWNGDILTEAPVAELLAVATARDAQVLAVSPRVVGEGTVGMDDAGRVVRLRGRVFGRETQAGDYVGVMALGPGVVARLPEQGCLMGDVALPDLAAGRAVLTVPSTAPWSDLGDIKEYVAANFAWLDAQVSSRSHAQSSILNPQSWTAPGVSVPPAIRVERSLLGSGATLSGSGRLREVIVWPGAPVQAPLERAVVLSSGRVVRFDETAEN
ncbi:MAG TPA: sugar phosphate nucleotidyltransferase [Polyangiaceae bacterium]|nr:sugar phosphate nucleotidyltransferase [Polyangiaceae bacterium]